MTDPVVVRVATVADAAVLAKLRYQFRSSWTKPTEAESEFLERCQQWMETQLATETWLCWVAVVDDRIIGHLWINRVDKIPNPLPEPELHAYLTNFYVCDDMRGCGIGNVLLQAALAWCDTAEVDTVILWPSAKSRPLYERAGFIDRGAVMTLDLGTARARASGGSLPRG